MMKTVNLKNMFSLKSILIIWMLLLPIIANADTNITIDGIKYRVNDSKKTASVISNGYSGNIIIPSKIDYSGITYTVNSIGARAFAKSDITSIDIPETVKTIGEEAFQECEGITSVKLPKDLSKIEERLFSNSTITEIVIPDKVTFVARSAFESCARLSSVIIGEKVDSIDYRAFSGCIRLAFPKIPNSVT